MVLFRTRNWCKLLPSGSCDPAMDYDDAALALTTVSAPMSSGQITDADVEVNGFNFMWARSGGESPVRGIAGLMTCGTR